VDIEVTVSLKLGEHLSACPCNWVNFINDLESRADHDHDCAEGFSVDILNQELKPFKAEYIDDVKVDFEDERHYTMFVLKYGGE